MHPVLRNALAVAAGIIIGALVNIGIVLISGAIIPPPEGVDVSNPEGIKASMHLFAPKHFIFPFLAHALGTLAGAYAAARIAITNHRKMALIVGGFFLVGGGINSFMIGLPAWFTVVDLLIAYIPMGLLGGRLAAKSS